MRVLILGLDKNIFEDGSLVQKRLILLAEKTVEITVLVPGEKDEQKEVSPHLRVCFVGGYKITQFFKMWRIGNTILRNGAITTHNKFLEKEGRKLYDLITVQDAYFLGLLAYLLARKFHVPFEVQVHGLEKFYGVRKLIAGFVLRRADKIRVVSERLKRELDSGLRTHDSRMYVLPVYTQIVGENPITNFANGDKKEFTFLTVGRLAHVKNIGMQIRAFARLAKESPNARLRIVGDGVERRNLQLITFNLQLDDKVVFEGRQNDVWRFYQKADAFLLTSDFEGWGVVVTEAACFGLPIIMTDVGLAGEFIKNGENGIVIPVDDEAALVAAMKCMIEDASLRARLGAAARRSFLALPSAEEQIHKQVEEWEKLRN